MSGHTEILIGGDFGAPLAAGVQSKKTIVIEASRTGDRRYEIAATGRNERLVMRLQHTRGWPNNRRGWTIPKLAISLRDDPRVTVAAFDFPFSIPFDLLQNPAFASRVAADVFQTRASWVHFVNQRVEMAFSSDSARGRLLLDPILWSWKDKVFWTKRATDIATNAQPPLKHMFQNLFNMTVVGSCFLRVACDGGMQTVMCAEEGERAPTFLETAEKLGAALPQQLKRSVIETYPGAVAPCIGFRGNYKQDPRACLETVEAYLRYQKISLNLHPDVRKFCLEYRTPPDDPDGADAFLCLVTAICFREGLVAWRTGAGTAVQLKEEGCIVTPMKL